MADSYVCSGAMMKCTMGTSPARLTVLPVRTVFLTGQPMANISDHQSMVNLAPFGLCRSMGFPSTASATAANHGSLTPMPCMHNTPFPWMGGKNDYIVKGDPALLKSSTCSCMWGGTISIIDDGQHGEGTQWVQKFPKESFSCITRKIENHYSSDEKEKTHKKERNVVQHENKENENTLTAKDNNHCEDLNTNDVLNDRISNAKDEEFSCVIRKIECHYSSEEKEKNVVLYANEETESTLASEDNNHSGDLTSNGILNGRISNAKDHEYYFITNHKGIEITLNCQREDNHCPEESHRQYKIDYVDIDSRELLTMTKEITDGRLKLYYYNLFYRAAEFAKSGFPVGTEMQKSLNAVGAVAAFGSAGGAIGAATGYAMDMICSLRFIHLPLLKQSDYKYACHTSLAYKQCPQNGLIPLITINTYPDIEFSLEIGGLGKSREYYADRDEKDKTKDTSFNFKFSVQYASIKKEVSLENVDEKELDEEAQKGSLFYKTVNFIADFFKSGAQLAQQLKEIIEAASGNDNNGVAKNVGVVGNVMGKIGTAPKWLKGSFEINPSLQGKWRYSVSDDLAKLGRHIELELGIDNKGELTIDLIEVADLFRKKTKKATTVVAAASSVASGGLAALPAVVIKFLVDTVVDWLVSTFKKGVKFELTLSMGANIKATSLTWDTSKDDIFDGQGLTAEIKPEIKLVAALEYKTPKIIIMSVKGEGEVGASAEAATSLTWILKLNVEKGYLGVDSDGSINPLTIKLEYKIAGSFEIFGLSFGSSSENVKEWKFKETEMEHKRWDWFKL